MKTAIIRIALSLCLFAAFGVSASPDRDDVKYTNQRVAAAHVQISQEIDEVSEDLKRQIRELELKIGDLSAKLAELDERTKEKLNAGSKNLCEVGKTAEGGDTKASWALWLHLPTALAMLAILVFAFWPRNGVAKPDSLDAASRPRCPRCGLEHDPEDMVCKNPACKTQF